MIQASESDFPGPGDDFRGGQKKSRRGSKIFKSRPVKTLVATDQLRLAQSYTSSIEAEERCKRKARRRKPDDEFFEDRDSRFARSHDDFRDSSNWSASNRFINAEMRKDLREQRRGTKIGLIDGRPPKDVDAYIAWAKTPEALKYGRSAGIKTPFTLRAEERPNPIDEPADLNLLSEDERSARAVWILRNCTSPETGGGKLSIAEIQQKIRPFVRGPITEYAVKRATGIASEFMAIDSEGDPYIIPGKFDRVEPMLSPGLPLVPESLCDHSDNLKGREHCPVCDHVAAENHAPQDPARRSRRLRDESTKYDRDTVLEAIRVDALKYRVDFSSSTQMRRHFRFSSPLWAGESTLALVRFQEGTPVFVDRILNHFIVIDFAGANPAFRQFVQVNKHFRELGKIVPELEGVALECKCTPEHAAAGFPFGTLKPYACPACKGPSEFITCSGGIHWFLCWRCESGLSFNVRHHPKADAIAEAFQSKPVPSSGPNNPFAVLAMASKPSSTS